MKQRLKQKSAWLWQNAEKILIIVFFATFTFNIRKVFLTPYSFLGGEFNEYMTISVSWADALMVGTIIIYNIKLLISQFIERNSANSSLKNVIRKKSSVIRIYYGLNVSRETFFLILFLAWSGLSIFWAQFRPIAAYRFLILLEIAFFAYIAVRSLNSAKWRNLTYYALITAGLLQAILGIAQFVHNGSIGFHFLGESILGPNINGVAKIIIEGEKHIRVYGTLPHPNILAGFLIVPFFILIGEIIGRYASRETLFAKIPIWLLWFILLTIGSGFFLTFSRSAFLGLFGGFIVLIICIYIRPIFSKLEPIHQKVSNYPACHSRESGDPENIEHTQTDGFCIECGVTKKEILVALSILTIATISIIIFLFNYTSFFSNQSLQERNIYQNVSRETISSHPFCGIGLGQFVFNEYNKYPNLEGWQYQPVHNVYLLIFSELGFVGLILLLLLITGHLSKIRRAGEKKLSLTYTIYYCIMFSFLVLSFFDHYFWDIKIGTLIFVLPLIFIGIKIRQMKIRQVCSICYNLGNNKF